MSIQANGKKKWKLVEKIVAAAFDEPNVRVQTNVRLRSIRRKGGVGGLREIDVLITGELVGQHVYFPIECKSSKRRIDSSAIDEFIGKLQDLGMATQTSIFVTTSGYTVPAIERANEVGMKTLVLKDSDALHDKNKLLQALQSHVFIACAVTEVSLVSDSQMVEFDKFCFFDKSGKYFGSLPDFIWEGWLRGTPPENLGPYSYKLKVHEDYSYLKNGNNNDIRDINIKFNVFALVLQFKGEAKYHHLVDALKGTTDRFRLTTDFTSSKPQCISIHTEKKLQSFLNEESAIAKITFSRLKLPKIIMNEGMLWPISSDMSELFKNIAPQSMEEFSQLAKSAGNNFWNFDPEYSELMKSLDRFSNNKFEIQPVD